MPLPRKAPLSALLVAICGIVTSVPLVTGTTAAEAANAVLADSVTVSAPAYGVTGNVTSGGVAVLDDIGSYDTASITGRAVLPGNVVTNFAMTKGLLAFGGTFTLDDASAGVHIDATVNGGVTRVSDTTVKWSGSATVRRGTSSTQQTVTVTVVDRVMDPGDHAVHITHAGQNRPAIVHVPSSRRGLPALFHFPGLLESPSIANQFDKLEPASDANGYLLVIPEHFGVGWQGVEAGTPFPDVDDPGYIRALASVVETRFGADPRRIYSSGMSNGGFFASLTGCELADVFAAFAPVSGQLNDPSTCAPGRKVPIVMFHGDADPLVSYDTTVPAVAFWTKNNGCTAAVVNTNLPDVDPTDGTTVIKHEYPNCSVVLYQIVGGGHAWPGGDPYPISQLGKATKDISANQIIWDFVSQFTLAT